MYGVAVCFENSEEVHFRFDLSVDTVMLKRLVKINISKLFAGDPTATKVVAV